MTLQDRIAEKKIRIESHETIIKIAKEELVKLEKVRVEELTPFQKYISEGYSYDRKAAWNAALRYVRIQAGYNPELLTFIDSAIEK